MKVNHNRRTARLILTLVAWLVLALGPVPGCSNGNSGKQSSQDPTDPAEGSTWDELAWDRGTWD